MPNELDPLNMFNSLLDFPFSVWIARLLVTKCPLCNNEYLEGALSMLAEGKMHTCFLCLIPGAILAKTLKLISFIFGFNCRDLKTFFCESWIRKILINEIRGIAIFGRSNPQVPSAPVILVWEITNECNLHCVYCHVDAKKALTNELTREEKLSLVGELADIGVPAILFAGGEPLCSPDLFDVINYAHERGLFTVVITNGTLLSTENAQKLAKAGLDYIKVSIDSANPKTHDSLRGEGSWERAVEGIKNSVKAGLTTGIAFTLTKASAKELPAVIALAKELAVKRVIIFNFVPSGRGKNLSYIDLTGFEREQALQQALQETYKILVDSDGIEISTTAPQGPRIVIANVLRRIPVRKWLKAVRKLTPYGRIQALAGMFSKGCSAGITVISIRPNGDVKPCDLMPLVIGNIREHRFRDIWLENACLNKLRNRGNVKGWCALCPFLTDCGGCRSRAYAYFGNLFASDPNCLYGKPFTL
jgi:radical SAM protein with 4Fe4S-binding SPASM domain